MITVEKAIADRKALMENHIRTKNGNLLKSSRGFPITVDSVFQAAVDMLYGADVFQGGCYIPVKRKRKINEYNTWKVTEGFYLPAHRVAMIGKMKRDIWEWVVDHLCCQKACVNPNHLELVTLGENRRRGSITRPTLHDLNGKLIRPRLSWLDLKEHQK